jgi:ABC-type nitrate/sulfonate/bicarbonate transport system substrate-binding protein
LAVGAKAVRLASNELESPPLPNWGFESMRTWFAFGLLAIVPLVACGQPATSTAKVSTHLYTAASPEPGTSIPSVNVTFGMRPYADNTFYVIAMKEGWYKDVGITIQPQPYGLKTTEDQWVSLLENGQVDMNSATCSILLPTYRTTDQLKCIALTVTFFGSVMLANPKLHLKTVADYAKSGMSFTDALKAALTPLVGKTVYVPAPVSEKEFDEEPFKLAGLPLPNYITSDDAASLVLAKSGRLDFMHPGGAPIAEQLLEAGWTPVYDTGQLLKYGPGGLNSPIEALVFNNGLAASATYVNAHTTTVLRFVSVMFRIFDALQKDSSLYAAYTPYLNSVAGTSLDAAGVQRTVQNLDPFVPFDQQTKYFDDTSSPEYYANSMGALITALEASGTIPKGITSDELIWAAPIYRQLVQLKTQTDALFTQAQGKQLSSSNQTLLGQAHQYYGWFDFLDSYRFAKAALGQ